MNRRALILMLAAALPGAAARAADDAAAPHTPKPGSAERKAICDAMRTYARRQCESAPGLQFLWTIGWLKVLGRHAAFSGCAVAPDGSPLDDGTVLGDIEFTTFLRKEGKGWRVIADLSRGDVPSEEELRELRSSFPKEIPTAIVPPFWRAKLR